MPTVAADCGAPRSDLIPERFDRFISLHAIGPPSNDVRGDRSLISIISTMGGDPANVVIGRNDTDKSTLTYGSGGAN
jgi:hypothetical protein